ncbi:MAG: esterase family protein [Kiritimatiellae bacterium]|nr:esterase family protein [Kiritimatiellia bacterium]
MHRLTLHIESPALNRPLRAHVLCPAGRGPFRVLYLLHGLGADADVWRFYDVETLAAPLRLMVVMPDGGASYYVNDPRPAGLGHWEDALMRDLRGAVDRLFRTLDNRGGRAVAGISMGGYGAVMLALRHPHLFAVAAGLSGSLYFGHAPHPRGQPFQTELSAALPTGAYDVFALAEQIVRLRAPKPALWLACGTEDGHLATNRAFRDHLVSLGWPPVYLERPGGHNREFWQACLPDLFQFVAQNLAPSAPERE